MKKVGLVAATIVTLFVLVTGSAWACQAYKDIVQDTQGNGIAGVTVTVYLSGTTTLATLYSEKTCTTLLSNPLLNSATGQFVFYAKNGRYTITTSKLNISFGNSIDAVLLDPVDALSNPLTVSGLIWSKVGGFKFPDNTIQITAGGGGGGAPVRWFDVKTYGAVADNITDDTASFNSAITAAGTQGLVFIPSGTYLIKGTITIPPGVRVVGSGEETTILHIPNTTTAVKGIIVFSNIPATGTTSSLQGGELEHVQIGFDQPDTSIRTSLTTYLPAIYAEAVYGYKVLHTRIARATIGIQHRGLGGTGLGGGTVTIDGVQISAFTTAFDLDGAVDVYRITNSSVHTFGMTTNQASIVNTVGTTGILLGRMDDFKLANSLIYYVNIGIKLYLSANGTTFGTFSNIDLDGMPLGIRFEAGVITGSSIFTSAAQVLQMIGGDLTIASLYALPTTTSAISVSPSTGNSARLELSGGRIYSGTGTNLTLINGTSSGGNATITITGMYLGNGAGTSAAITAVGNAVLFSVSGNTYGSSAPFFSADTDIAHTVVGNQVGGATIIGPSGATHMVVAGNGNLGSTSTSVPTQLSTPLYSYGAGQATTSPSTTTGLGGALLLQDTGALVNDGGMILFGATQGFFAGIKGLLTNGTSNTAGNISLSVRNLPTDTTLTEAMQIQASSTIVPNLTLKSTASAPQVVGTSKAQYEQVRTTGWVAPSLDINDYTQTVLHIAHGVPTGIPGSCTGCIGVTAAGALTELDTVHFSRYDNTPSKANTATLTADLFADSASGNSSQSAGNFVAINYRTNTSFVVGAAHIATPKTTLPTTSLTVALTAQAGDTGPATTQKSMGGYFSTASGISTTSSYTRADWVTGTNTINTAVGVMIANASITQSATAGLVVAGVDPLTPGGQPFHQAIVIDGFADAGLVLPMKYNSITQGTALTLPLGAGVFSGSQRITYNVTSGGTTWANAIIGEQKNNAPINTTAFPAGVTGYGTVLNTGNQTFGVFGRADLPVTTGVATNELNSFNVSSGDATAVYPPDRTIGTAQSLPIALTVAAGGSFKSAIGVHIVKEGSAPQQFRTGIYMNPDAISDYGLFIDADSINSAGTLGALVKTKASVIPVQVQTVGTVVSTNSLLTANANGVNVFAVKQGGYFCMMDQANQFRSVQITNVGAWVIGAAGSC